MESKFYRYSISLGSIFLYGAVLIGLYFTSRFSYTLFHSLAEFFSITIGFTVFVIVWNTRHQLDNSYVTWLGISFLFVTSIDLIHALAYKGMGVFTGFDANLPTQLWIASRYLQSLSILVAILFSRRKPGTVPLFTGYLVITALLFILIFTGIFPTCYIEGQGLTPFKINSEYIIIGILLVSGALLWHNRETFDSEVMNWLLISQALMICAELAFTAYISVYGPANMIGHFLKLIAFFYVYKAVVKMGLERPHRLLFRNLKQSETALRQALEEVQKLAVTDPLTGLNNRRYFFELAEHEFQHARRYQRNLSTIMLDLDNFKNINDTYGHVVGDKVLQEVADCCRQETRKVDVVARYGGEEFIFILPEIDQDGAAQVADRLRQSIASKCVTTQAGDASVTGSLGIATLNEEHATLESLLIAADFALYQAKDGGGNRIHCAPQPEAEPPRMP